jgi:DNA-binding NtrC family response regulator
LTNTDNHVIIGIILASGCKLSISFESFLVALFSQGGKLVKKDQVLIVDDEPLICDLVDEVLQLNGYETHIVNDGYEALKAIQTTQFLAIVLDIKLPKMDGLEVLERVKAFDPNILVIIMTGNATIDSAKKAIKSGAYEYLTKPFPLINIVNTIKEATSERSIGTEEALSCLAVSMDIITSNPQMLEILKKVKLMAQSNSTVLIQGESGTGKELVARAIHRHSNRANNSFIAVNCAALPESLLESEMFGYEKGAFTGAIARRIGKFEQAHKGTLLLDEIAEMPKSSQAKLLRAIQEREIVRIGGTEQIKVDVRIIAVTNKDLLTEIDSGNFREDLFYRLSVVTIFLPPLRERKEDIPLLVQYFAKMSSEKMGKNLVPISPEVMHSLMNYSWPGNIRELENAIESALALSPDGKIKPNNIRLKGTTENVLPNLVNPKSGTTLDRLEKDFILLTLQKFNGNKEKAAKALGITSRTLRNKLHNYLDNLIY